MYNFSSGTHKQKYETQVPKQKYALNIVVLKMINRNFICEVL